MKITNLKNTGSTTMTPCEIVDRFLLQPDYFDFLKQFEFDSLEEIAEGYKYLCRSVVFDQFCRTKANRDNLPAVSIIYTQCKNIVNSMNPNEKYRVVAESLWLNYFERKKMERNFELFYSVEKSPEKLKNSIEKMREWWKYTDKDIEALRYMVCQAKIGRTFPTKLQRAIYIWSEEKFTGKTTVAEMFVACLNGEPNCDNIENYKSDVPHEWQFERFAVPESLHKRAILLDEAFSGKNGTENYYPRVKDKLTSNNCKYEVKGGGFFNEKCYRNYFITSNYPPEKFIHDKSERRFFVINMKHRPPMLTDDAIFEVIADFCRNVEPEENIAQWYRDTMPEVMGSIGYREIEMANALRSENFLNVLRGWRDSIQPKHKVYFPSDFKKWLFNEAGIVKTDRNAETVESSVVRAFGEPKVNKANGQKYYNTNSLIDKIEDEDDVEFVDDGRPF